MAIGTIETSVLTAAMSRRTDTPRKAYVYRRCRRQLLEPQTHNTAAAGLMNHSRPIFTHLVSDCCIASASRRWKLCSCFASPASCRVQKGNIKLNQTGPDRSTVYTAEMGTTRTASTLQLLRRYKPSAQTCQWKILIPIQNRIRVTKVNSLNSGQTRRAEHWNVPLGCWPRSVGVYLPLSRFEGRPR